MKCPHCGTENAAGARVCVACGGQLADSASLTEALPSQDATTVASLVEQRTRRLASALEETAVVSTSPTSAADATRRIAASVPTVGDETASASVDPTTMRPVLKQTDDQYYVVRNTRDYDHDAQSVNHAATAERFETLASEEKGRNVRSDPYARSARKGDAPGEGNSRSKLRPLLAIFIIALVFAGGGAILTYGLEMWGGRTVPPVIGETQANAEASLQKKGLTVHVEAEPADDGIGRVLSQTPDPGTRIEEGTEVLIVVATNRTVPEVVGLSEEDARAKLADAGAETVDKKEVSSSEPEGTVVGVSPEEGKSFVSRNNVTIMVAVPFRVPDVTGAKENDAIKQLEEAGFSTEKKYIESDKTVRTVVETEPRAGETVEEGGHILVVISSPFPKDVYHVLDYFGHSSQDVDKFLDSKGFRFEKGAVDSNGNALALYRSDEEGEVKFSTKPYLKTLTLPKDDKANPLSTGAPIAGVRFELPADKVPGSFDRPGIEGLVRLCGLGGITEYVDTNTMPTPSGYAKSTAKFACATGSSNGLNWCVFMTEDGGKRAFVACGKEGLYKAQEIAADMAKFDNSLAKFTVYQEIYLVSGKTEEKKDDKAKTSQTNQNSQANKQGQSQNQGNASNWQNDDEEEDR